MICKVAMKINGIITPSLGKLHRSCSIKCQNKTTYINFQGYIYIYFQMFVK